VAAVPGTNRYLGTQDRPTNNNNKSHARKHHEIGSKQAYSSTLKMEALVDFLQITWCYTQKDRTFIATTEDRTLYSHCCENVKSNFMSSLVVIFQNYKRCLIQHNHFPVFNRCFFVSTYLPETVFRL
jgi:hypothetical protein